MILHELNILNYKNIHEASLTFSDKINCFIGLNGQGKTNLLDAIYFLSFTKSAFNNIDSQNISHEEEMAMLQGSYYNNEATEQDQHEWVVSCGLKRGIRKQFRLNKVDYPRLLDHIGLLPLVMVSPEDQQLVAEGSDERRRFMDGVIAQQDKKYIEDLTTYNALLKQRNALLKLIADSPQGLDKEQEGVLEVIEQQMIPLAEYIYQKRAYFIEHFIPYFQTIYSEIVDGKESVSLQYISQLQNRDLGDSFVRTRSRDVILGWTSQGIHKDDLEMQLGEYPLKRVGSQGQQKTYLLSIKLAQAVYLGKPILLLDDIFDKLDAERVERIVRLVRSDRFGQIFITDTDRQHLTQWLGNTDAQIFHVEKGAIV